MKRILLVCVLLLGVSSAQNTGARIEKVKVQCPSAKQLKVENVCFAYGDFFKRFTPESVQAVYTVTVGKKSSSFRESYSYREESFLNLGQWKEQSTFDRAAIFVQTNGALYLSLKNPIWAQFYTCEANGVFCERILATPECQKNPYLCKGWIPPDAMTVTYTMRFNGLAPLEFRVTWK